jgi:glycine cleavage system T protein (aminomethyltransferase)
VSLAADMAPLKRTPLDALHQALGAKMVPFAGWEMPVQYPAGILAEHLHTRAKAGLFDVSHMGQARLRGAAAAEFFERLVPGDILGLAPGHMRYTLLLNERGGILDDLMATRREDGLFLVVNAARKEADFAHIADRLMPGLVLEPLGEQALLALQGPMAAEVLARFAPGIERLPFLTAREALLRGKASFISRSGYTGEDGFEISLAARDAAAVAEILLKQPEVMPIGLGARDSLRLEAGLCLYGHDIDETTTPVMAGLAWTIGRRRREAGGFPGAATVLRELAEGVAERRVGIRPDGRAPARDGTQITAAAGTPIGRITSGGYGPTVGGPIAMGYVARDHAAEGAALSLVVRDVPRPARVVRLPFVATHYYRG